MTADPTQRLAGMVAIVTGASFGIGSAIAELFAAQGARVAVVARSKNQLDELVAKIRSEGGQAIALDADVADESAVKRVVDATVAEFGTINILVNNAGIMPAGTAETTTTEAWHHVLDVNLSSIFYFARQVVPIMRAGGSGGSIVNIASVQGLRGHPNRIAYASSKHGVIGITRALAADYAADRIRVNAICPGTIDTPMLHRELEKFPETERAAVLDSYRKLHPIGAIGDPVDVAWAALFFASPEAKFVTGADLAVDGGYTALIVHE